MGPDLTSLPRTTACPACGAALRPEATWCSLCFTDFRAAAAPAQPAAPAAEHVQPAVPSALPAYGVVSDPLTAPLLDLLIPAVPAVPAAPVAAPLAEAAPAPVPAQAPEQAAPKPTWPCLRCGERNAIQETVCLGCGAGFLAHASEKPKLVLPLVGDLYALSRGQRVGLAAAVAGALVLPLAVATLLATGSPPPKDAGGTAPTSVTSTQP